MTRHALKLSGILILLLVSNLLYSTPQLSDQEDQVFEVTSLSARRSQLVKLTIRITPEGVASVSKSFFGRSISEVYEQHLVAKDLIDITETSSGDGFISVELKKIPQGNRLYWVPIDLDEKPQPTSQTTIYWTCKTKKCKCHDICDLNLMSEGYKPFNILCLNSGTEDCELRSSKKDFALRHRTGSGVYILAKEVHYLDLPEEKPMRERDFHGGSLTADGSRYIQLSVDYDSLGIAHVTKDTRPPRRNDKVKVYFNTSQNSVVFSTPMDDNYEEINYENRYEKDTIYWIPIAMDSPPVGIPGSKIKVWCEGEKEGFARSVFFWGTNYVDCSESSSELNISINGSEPHTGGGIYLYAKGIVYE